MGKEAAWKDESGGGRAGPCGHALPLEDGRVLPSALRPRMRGLGVDSPRGSTWVQTERQLLPPQRSPGWLCRDGSSPGRGAVLGFSSRRAVLMSLVVVSSGPGRGSDSPRPPALIRHLPE